MFKRAHQNTIYRALKPNFVVVLYGARRTGKTVLMNTIKELVGEDKVLMVNGEDLDTAELLASQKVNILVRFVKGYQYLFIDEAQAIPGIGMSLKLMADSIPGVAYIHYWIVCIGSLWEYRRTAYRKKYILSTLSNCSNGNRGEYA